MKKFNIAVVGATGNVGTRILDCLAQRQFPIAQIYAVASQSSLGKDISFGDDVIKVTNIESIDFSRIDIAFFCTNEQTSQEHVLDAASQGCIIIDKSSYFRMDPDVPLIVPEVNIIDLKNYSNKNIIANPNCVAILLSVALKPLDNAAKIKRLVISTYQSVSGAGKEGMDELYNNTKARYGLGKSASDMFPRQIAFNLIPQIGDLNRDGLCGEEVKIEQELKKIIGSHVSSTVTCVRVPVFISHSMSVNVEFENSLDAQEATEILMESDGITVLSDNNNLQYITPAEVVGEEQVYISRIRLDQSNKNSLNLWIVGDNLYKGAALNAVQIAEELIQIL